MKKIGVASFLLFTIIAFSAFSQAPSALYPFSMEYNPDRTLIRIDSPEGFDRYPIKKMDMFQTWITNLPLCPAGRRVARWDNQAIMSADSVTAVIDFGVATSNQRDADIPLQLMAEFLRASNKLGDFPIILNQGDTVTFDKWLNGEYYYNSAQQLAHRDGPKREASDQEYHRYLQFVITQNDNKSLRRNLVPITESEIAPGAIYIQFQKDAPDSTGHAAVILDVCANKKGETLYLAGWGGNPAHAFIVARPWPITKRIWFNLAELKQQLKEYGDGSFFRFPTRFPLQKAMK